jgi:hypothetical protein
MSSQLGHLFIEEMGHKTKRLWIRMSPEEERLLKEKAVNYKTISSMVWDAIKIFDDKATIGKFDALNEMIALYRKYQQDLSWMGGNFNQVVKRANELAIGEELTMPYFKQVLFPKIEELQNLLCDIKREQHQIAKNLTKL